MSISQGNGHILSINADHSIEDQRKNIWVINKIKEAKGISILAHPNWVYRDAKYHLNQAFYKEMLKSSHLDGVEVFGEEKIKEHNNMTHLTALQIKNKHKYLAPFANSDAHDSDHETGDRFTIVFVKDKSASSIVKAMKDELAQYVYFLIKEYYPRHTILKAD
ncbi:MAG: hypothetical protein L3J10_00895 [Sulfurimonas sp.]|nr:hypothetical protein [Sulfurimonas sp.]